MRTRRRGAPPAKHEAAEFRKRQGKPFPDEARLAKLRAEVDALTAAIYGEPGKAVTHADAPGTAVTQADEAVAQTSPPYREGEGRFSLMGETVVSEPGDGFGKAGTPEASTVEMRTGFTSARALGHHLASGRHGALVRRLIDAGKIVLHDDESTLPERQARTSSGPQVK